MAKRFDQIRYYFDSSPNNYPIDVNYGKLQHGTAFDGKTPILKLGIQTLPGVKFHINKNAEEAVMIGSTGIYELDLEGATEISGLSFEGESLNMIIASNEGSLLIDFIYDDGEGS